MKELTLHEACKKGDSAKVKLLLQNNADFDERDDYNRNPLFLAVSGSHIKCAELILKTASEKLSEEDFELFINSIQCLENQKTTCLNIAVERNSFLLSRLLLDNFADINDTRFGKKSPLEIIVERRMKKILSMIVGEDVERNDFLDNKNLMEILHSLVITKDDSILKIFIDAICRFEDSFRKIANKKHFENERTLTHIAAEVGYVKCLSLIVCSGGVIDIKDKSCCTPLHKAAREGNLDAVKFLVEMGANINAQNNKKDTPMHVAVHYGKDNIIKYLRTCDGLDVDATNHKNRTAFHKAAICNNISLARLLFNRGCRVDITDIAGKTALQYPQFQPDNKFLLKIEARLELFKREQKSKYEASI